MAMGITVRRRAAQKLRNRLMDYRTNRDLDGEIARGQVENILSQSVALARAQGLSPDRIRELVESRLGSVWSISA